MGVMTLRCLLFMYVTVYFAAIHRGGAGTVGLLCHSDT